MANTYGIAHCEKCTYIWIVTHVRLQMLRGLKISHCTYVLYNEKYKYEDHS